MKDLPSFLIGLGAGALLMYYLDQPSGGRRRALVRDKFVSAGHGIADFAEAKAKRAADRVKGMVATGTLHGETRREPQTARQLHDRIRARLGRLISHPKALHVLVDDGSVTLSGHILSREVNSLIREIKAMPGVRQVRNELTVHDKPDGVSELQGRTDPPGRQQESSGLLQS